MIRITQSYLINQTISFFTKSGWILLYSDIPGGRRSGVGMHANINKIWEQLYNLSPDIVFENNGKVILIEVDKKLNEEYIEKFNKYISKEEELKNKLSIILTKKIDYLEFGFVAKSEKYNIKIDNRFKNFNFIFYKNGDIVNRIINPF